jgi:hypothetical protein
VPLSRAILTFLGSKPASFIFSLVLQLLGTVEFNPKSLSILLE